MDLKNKFILEWAKTFYGGWPRRLLRRVTGETPKYYCAQTTRVFHTENNEVVTPLCYSFDKRYERRDKKEKTNLIDTNDLSELKVNYSFDEFLKYMIDLGEDDIIGIRYEHRKNCYPKMTPFKDDIIRTFDDVSIFMENRTEQIKTGIPLKPDYGAIIYDNIIKEDTPIIEHLESLFNCSVYMLHDRFTVSYDSTNPVHISTTMYHINHFNENVKVLSSEENKLNQTIFFWYFGDKMVFSYAHGYTAW